MKINYKAYVESVVEIDDSELEGMSESQKQEYLQEVVTDQAYEDVDLSLVWDVDDEN